jgi:hypothetical protein
VWILISRIPIWVSLHKIISRSNTCLYRINHSRFFYFPGTNLQFKRSMNINGKILGCPGVEVGIDDFYLQRHIKKGKPKRNALFSRSYHFLFQFVAGNVFPAVNVKCFVGAHGNEKTSRKVWIECH